MQQSWSTAVSHRPCIDHRHLNCFLFFSVLDCFLVGLCFCYLLLCTLMVYFWSYYVFFYPDTKKKLFILFYIVIFFYFIQQLSLTRSTISDEKKTYYLMGDFNWNLLSRLSDSHVRDFINLFYSHDFIPCIDRPTRIKTNKHDHTSTNNISESFFINSGVIRTDLSHHFPVFIT